jgi:5'-deoxynucleotidase YfbR-like HD superfamily hydrolase
LHDAPEYVIGDMISPFKAVVGGGYKTVEKRLEAAIHLRFGLPPHPSAATQGQDQEGRPDRRLFRGDRTCRLHGAEARKFFGQPRGITSDMLAIAPLPAMDAQARFAERFHVIEGMRSQAA